MKTFQTLALILLTLLASSVEAQRIKGGAGFLKVGVAHSPGAGFVLDQIAPAGVSGFGDQSYMLGAGGYYRTGNIILALDGNVGAQSVRSSGDRYGEGFTYLSHAKFGWIINQGHGTGFIHPLVLVWRLWP